MHHKDIQTLQCGQPQGTVIFAQKWREDWSTVGQYWTKINFQWRSVTQQQISVMQWEF